MLNIIENPVTKELFLEGAASLYDFTGTPHHLKNTDGWTVVSQAECVKDWFVDPGKYATLSMVAQVCLIPTADSKPEVFTMGGTLSYIRSWIADAQARNFDAYLIDERAYSCRNQARNLAQVEA